jgi:hypothetical protein
MFLHPWPHCHTRSGHPPQSSSRTLELDKVICLSRQKLRLEIARGEPDLRKLLAHVYTVEHIQAWLRANPPSRKAPSQAPVLELNDQKAEMSLSLRQIKTDQSISHYWPAGDLRRTVTVVREVEPDDGTNDDDDDGDESSDRQECWNGSDTSDDTVVGKYTRAEAHEYCSN